MPFLVGTASRDGRVEVSMRRTDRFRPARPVEIVDSLGHVVQSAGSLLLVLRDPTSTRPTRQRQRHEIPSFSKDRAVATLLSRRKGGRDDEARAR